MQLTTGASVTTATGTYVGKLKLIQVTTSNFVRHDLGPCPAPDRIMENFTFVSKRPPQKSAEMGNANHLIHCSFDARQKC